MFRNRFLLVGLFLIVLAILYYSFFEGGNTDTPAVTNPESYRAEVAQKRKDKDDYFRTSTESPFTDKAKFKGLTYFNPDPAYRLTARLEPFADKKKLVVRLTDGSEEVYEKYAHAVFTLQDEVCRLLVLKHENTLSILFKDQTSGKETYGGGRYLDLSTDDAKENRIVIDFNEAYNPYCVYNHEYACPIPPAENTLPVAVRAGEKFSEP
ncbi:DUF1684 domain-containing protein [Larkinella sp. VNQ87]|uniref:DUF1684 domain-containing protein n=1 Tax=Larkinella sp. VNQ87 TaxID=3400921 RepID=UPI003C06350B